MPVFALAYLNDALVAQGGGRRRALDGAAPADRQRHPSGGGDRARRGAERSLPALVLELERPFDGDRAELAGQGRTRPTRRTAAGRVAAQVAEGRTLGQHAGERAGARGAGLLLPQVRVGDAGLHGGREARRRTPLATAQFQGRSTEAKAADVPMAKLLASAPGRDPNSR